MGCFSLFPVFGVASPNHTSRKATLNAISNLHQFSNFPSATTCIHRETAYSCQVNRCLDKLVQDSVLLLHRPCCAGAVSPSLSRDKKSILKYHHLSPDSNFIFSMHPQPVLVHELVGKRVGVRWSSVERRLTGWLSNLHFLSVVFPKHICGPALRCDGVMSRSMTELLHRWPDKWWNTHISVCTDLKSPSDKIYFIVHCCSLVSAANCLLKKWKRRS